MNLSKLKYTFSKKGEVNQESNRMSKF